MRKPCCDKEKTNKGAWSKQEDQKLINYIQQHGEGNWSSLPQAAGLLRCGKSCRLRWLNYLRPDVKRGNFGEDEDDLIIKLHALLGNRWSLIAGRLPGRTDNEVKNYWNSHLRRKLPSKGNIEKPKRGAIRRRCDCGSTLITKASDDEEKVNAKTASVDEEEKGTVSLDLDLNLSLPHPAEEEVEQQHRTTTTMAAQEYDEGNPSLTLALFK